MKNSYISSSRPARRYRVRAVHVMVFVALFVVLLGALEFFNRAFFVAHNAYYLRLTRFLAERGDIEILFLGDSHLEYAVDTELLPYKAYNLSFGGINSIQSYYMLKGSIDRMPDLKIVVVPLDHHCFHPYKSNRFELFFVDKYLDWRELLPLKGPRILLTRFNYFTVLDDTLGRKSFVEKAVNRILGKKAIGFGRATPAGPAKALALDKDLLLYFYKTLELCGSRNIKVVTVATPLRRDYIASAEKKLYHIDDIERFIFGNRKYGGLIYRHFNYIDWDPDDRSLFKDGHHLSRKGREAFTPVIAEDLADALREIPKGETRSPARTGP